MRLEDFIGLAELERNTPSDVLLMLDGFAGAGTSGSIEKGFLGFLSQLAALFPGSLGEGLRSAVTIVLIAAMCAVACSIAQGNVPQYVRLAGVLSIATATVIGMSGLMETGREAISQMNTYSKAMLPALATAASAAGKPASAIFRHAGTVFAADLLLTMYERLLYPLLYIYAALVTFCAALPHNMVKRVASLIRKTVLWLLTATLGLFTVYLTIGGAISGSADALSVKTAQTALGGFVPVVGGIISDASETLLLGASVIKNTVGVVGLFAILSTAAAPLVMLAVRAGCMKLCAALAGVLGSEGIPEYLDELTGLYTMLLGMVSASAFLLIISIVSTISAGS